MLQVKEVKGLPDEDYHGNSTHLSSSQIKIAYKDLNKFHASVYEGLQKYDTNALKFGRAAHALILEPKTFNNKYAIFDDSMDMRRKESKEIKKDFLESIKGTGQELLNASDYDKICKMTEAVEKYAPAKELLSGGDAEVSYFFNNGELDLKIRPDYINHTTKTIVDLKTSRDATEYSFARDVKFNFHYDLSAAMYLDGIKRYTGEDYSYYFVVVEKDEPYSIAVYKLGEETLKFGKQKYEKALEKIIQAKERSDYRLQTRIQEI